MAQKVANTLACNIFRMFCICFPLQLLDILDLGMEKQFRENKFGKPCVFHARLPLNHMIIKITAPKRYLLGNLPNEYSHIISTYDGDFCRVRMNPKLFVEEIVCVTRKVGRIMSAYMHAYSIFLYSYASWSDLCFFWSTFVDDMLHC